jgi:hypothetical protein
MSNISQIRTKIKDTLVGMNTPTAIFWFVSDIIDVQPTWYPAVYFEPDKLESNILDTSNNERNYIFKIIIEQEATNKTKWEALNILTSVFDKVIDKFDTDYTLWWVCELWVDPMNADFVMAKIWETWAILAVIFDLHCKTFKQII